MKILIKILSVTTFLSATVTVASICYDGIIVCKKMWQREICANPENLRHLRAKKIEI